MGMFDDFKILDPELAKTIKCHYGHESNVDAVFQTKDLDCALSLYAIKNYKLHQIKFGFKYGKEGSSEEPIVIDYTGHVSFYDSCEQCEPILFHRKNMPNEVLTSIQPWIEYKAVFRRGELLFIDPVKLETLEEIEQHLTDVGCSIVKK